MTRPSQGSWNTGSCGAGSTGPKPCMPPISWTVLLIALPQDLGRWIDVVRPSTARCARAQDEEVLLMPSKTYLILSSAEAKPGRVSKDADRWCSRSVESVSTFHLCRRFRQAGADHAVARDEFGELLLAQLRASVGPHRQHEKAGLGSRIPDAHLGLLRQFDAEIREHALRVDDRARAVGRRFVPDRRQPQHFPGVAGAQCANDKVVQFGRVLQRDQMSPDRADMPERIGRFGRIFE